MKQFFTFLTAILLGSFSFSQAFQSDFSSWANGVPTDWDGAKTNLSSSNITEIPLGATYGTSMGQLINTGSGHKRFSSQLFSVTGNETYNVKFWVVADTGDIRVGFWENTGTLSGNGYSSYSSYFNLNTESNGNLVMLSQTFTVPSYATDIEFIFSLRNTNSTTGIIIDSVSIEQFINTAVAAPHSIYDLQYTTAMNGESPYLDSLTITSGVVTATRSGSNTGYWIQDGNGAWNGIFVNDGVNTPAIGDSVTIEGMVAENFDASQIEAVSNYTLESAPVVIPMSTTINSVDLQTMEDYEGVLVTIIGAICTDENALYGQWVVNNGTVPTDSAVVDDDMFAYLPTLTTSYDITGIGDYSYGIYKILPRDINDIIGAIPPAILTIYDIQYSTASNGDSPEVGNTVTTNGIVTGITAAGDFFIQDGDGAWNGLYIFENGTTVVLGDEVEVTGTVLEYNGLTEMGSVSNVSILSSGNALPNATNISTSNANMEEYEGVLIMVSLAECTNNSEGFGLWSLNDNSGTIKGDDDIFDYATTAVEGSYYDVTGIGHYSFSEYKILPRDLNDIVIVAFNGLEENSMNVTIYPNPSNDVITLNGINSGLATIYSLNGKVVYQSLINGTKIDISTLETGFYNLVLSNENGQQTVKLIVE